MQNKLNSFTALLVLSLLLHLAIAALVLQQRFIQPPSVTKPAPIQVFAVTRPQAAPPAAAAQKPPAPATKPARPAPKPAGQRPPAPAVVKTPPLPAAQPRQRPARNTTPASPHAPTVAMPPPATTAPTLDLSAVLSTVQQQAQRRELSAAELAALSTPKSDPMQTRPPVRRPQVKPGSGPAADVLESLPDGSQLVRVGKKCVLASPGADLRKDIHSMKLVACGAGGNREQDAIDAHFEQVMSRLGQHR